MWYSNFYVVSKFPEMAKIWLKWDFLKTYKKYESVAEVENLPHVKLHKESHNMQFEGHRRYPSIFMGSQSWIKIVENEQNLAEMALFEKY